MNEERELKFRIWVHIDKAFTYFDIYDYPSGIAFGVSYPMQFTGIKDSQGNDVYEGDIISDSHISVQVIFQSGSFGAFFDNKSYCGDMGIYNQWFHQFYFDAAFQMVNRNQLRKFKVIGNIIEHKHLLN